MIETHLPEPGGEIISDQATALPTGKFLSSLEGK